MNNMRLRRLKKQKGFSLVETLVAISILLVAIMGPMTIAARGLQSAFYAREQITAFSLAQEGVEMIRQKRDEKALEGNSNWLAGIDTKCIGSNRWCGLDARAAAARDCVSETCQLNDAGAISASRGFYTYAAGTPTPFTRRIRVNPSGGREAEITVEVSWHSGLFAGEKTVTIQSRIFNQYDDM